MPGRRAVCILAVLLWQGQDLCWDMTWQYGRLFQGFLNTHPFAEQRGEVSKEGHCSGKGGFCVLLCHAMLYYVIL